MNSLKMLIGTSLKSDIYFWLLSKTPDCNSKPRRKFGTTQQRIVDIIV